MTQWTRQRRIGKNRDSASVVVTKYTIPAETAREIRKAGPIYGSQGRALQVATEVLIRMARPPEVEPFGYVGAPGFVRVSSLRHQRPVDMIPKLAELEAND